MIKKTVKLLVSLALIALGGIFIYIFRYNVPSHIVNAATVLGTAAGCALVAAGIFLPWLIKTAKKLWQKKAGKFVLCLLGTFAAAALAVYGFTFGTIVHAQANTADTQSPLIVLGCQVRPGGTPSLMLSRRIDAAYDYLTANPEAVAILCGGQGSDEDMAEAQCMYNILTQKGIAPGRLFVEDSSVNTDENIRNATEIIEKNGLSKEVAVATSDFHQKRAAMICADHGLTAYAVNSPSPGYLVPVFYTREVLGVLKEAVM